MALLLASDDEKHKREMRALKHTYILPPMACSLANEQKFVIITLDHPSSLTVPFSFLFLVVFVVASTNSVVFISQ